eukprot:TRINITY_DN8407_c0_g1_i1.p1 TRINITY_DN8407_c0_g1~~TRINITY_DN8407_c0_g1_i1.p1  ORF type:complete len:4892 (+),score=1969.11 TRINITY_DN8407_c0_g1_i1:217-14892(+)
MSYSIPSDRAAAAPRAPTGPRPVPQKPATGGPPGRAPPRHTGTASNMPRQTTEDGANMLGVPHGSMRQSRAAKKAAAAEAEAREEERMRRLSKATYASSRSSILEAGASESHEPQRARAAASTIPPGVLQWILRHVEQQLGLDPDLVRDAGDACDMALGRFAKGESERLLWFAQHPALDTASDAGGAAGADADYQSRQTGVQQDDDAISRVSQAISTTSMVSMTSSKQSGHDDDSQASSHTSDPESSVQEAVLASCDRVFSLLNFSCVYFLRTDLHGLDPDQDPPPLTAHNIHSIVVVGRIAPASAGAYPDLLGSLLERLDVIFYPAIASCPQFGELTSQQQLNQQAAAQEGVPHRRAHHMLGDIPATVAPEPNPSLAIPEVAHFVKECCNFRTGVFDCASGVSQTVNLARPLRRFDIDFSQKAMLRAAQKREVVQCYEHVVDQWKHQIDKALSRGITAMPSRALRTVSPLSPIPSTGHPAGEAAQQGIYGDDDGPDSELLFWKVRMTQLNHITDQLNSKPNKTIIGVLNLAGPRAARCMEEWAETFQRVTDGAQEAKDNVKYLQTLDSFCWAFYAPEPCPQAMMQVVPQCINVIKMIHAISRHYNTSERMTGLFVKITNQMIRSCKRYLERDGKIWDQEPDVAMKALRSCIELNQEYKHHFRQTKEELSAKLFGRQFDFSEEAIFGKFNLFCGRLQKVIDVMHVRSQFNVLREADNIDNLQPLIKRFDMVMSTLKFAAAEGYLEANLHDFDGYYQQFKQDVQELSLELVVFINNCFLMVADTSKALQVLARFRAVVCNQHISRLLDEKHTAVFHSYGRDLEAIKAAYERDKEAPPRTRNMPPVAGAIAWVRQLLRKIEDPMKHFQKSPQIFASRDAKRIIKSYNRAARAFVTFEARWFEKWRCEAVERARSGLQATLLVCDKATSRVYVNFDTTVVQLIREVHCLQRMGLSVPSDAIPIYAQRHALFRYNEELNYIVQRYYRVIDQIDPLHCGIVIPHVNLLNSVINPGLVQYQWSSLNVDQYLSDVSRQLDHVEALVQRVNGVMRCRMDASCDEIRRLSWVCITKDLSSPEMSWQCSRIDEVVAAQKKHSQEVAHRISVLNYEVAAATREVVQVTTQGYTAEERRQVHDAVEELYQTYEHKVFQAILHCMQQSVLYLKARVAGPAGVVSAPGSFLFPQTPIFSVEVLVRNRCVEVSPSLEDAQRCVNRMARAMLESTRRIYRWRQDDQSPCDYDVVEYQGAVLRAEQQLARKGLPAGESSGSDSDRPQQTCLKSLFLRIGKNRRMTKVFLQLTGAVGGLQEQLSNYLMRFSAFDELLKRNRADEMERFNARTDLAFSDYEDKIRHYYSLERATQQLPQSHTLCCLHIDLSRVNSTLLTEAQAWKRAYGISLNARVRAAMDELVQTTEDLTAKLNRRVQDLSDVNAIMAVISRIRLDESVIEMKLRPIVDTYDSLHRLNVKVTKEEQDQVDRIGFQWNNLVQQSRSHMDYLQEVGPRFKRVLLHDVAQFQQQVAAFMQDYDKNGPMVADIEPRLAVERLKAFQKQHSEKQRKLVEYRMGEELFGLPTTQYPEMERIDRELKLLARLYDLYTEVLTHIQRYEEVPWGDIDLDTMREAFRGFKDRVKRMPRGLRDWQAYRELQDIVEEFLDTLPLLELLVSRTVVERHWNELSRICGVSLTPRAIDFKLRNMLAAKLTDHRVEIEELHLAAQKEAEIETKLTRIREEWTEREVTLEPFKNRGLLKLKPDATSELLQRVEEAQTTLTTLLTSRFNEPFKRDIILWVHRLTTIQERIGQWLEVQHLWIYMEAVFSGSGDIGKEMPTEVKRFSNIDRQWVKIMRTAAESPAVLKICLHSDMLCNLLPHLQHYLDLCQKSLSGYLSQKRFVFPRFNFVSSSQLLEILGQGSDPSSIQVHLPSLTNFSSVEFDMQTRKVISFKSDQGETVHLKRQVSTEGDVVDWLQTFLDECACTLRSITRAMMLDLSGLDASVMELRQWLNTYPAQLCLLGLQVSWTSDCEQALVHQKSEKGIMGLKTRKGRTLQEHLVNLTRLDLQPRMRTNVEALITVQIHNNDVLFALTGSGRGRFRVRSAQDFEWLKQLRFYWRVEGETCTGSVTDIDFPYAFEYIGCVDRLVVTDLTDRIYISCAQAMGMGYGGAPTGPAGTGKTETVKDMGRSFGRYVIVMNCSDQMNVRTMGNMFTGIAMSGCWCGFDEINRVEVKVLSVVAAQVACIFNGRRSRQQEVVFPDGATVPLDPLSAVFVTLNPGYAGRSSLPENMKAVFRSCPHRQAIMRVRLAAAGFQESAPLSKQCAAFYQLREDQLSGQRHYDFGLRSILSVLRACGPMLRGRLTDPDCPKDVERLVLVQVLRDMNLSKLVEDASCSDGLLFEELLRDIFPGVPPSQDATRRDMHGAILTEAAREGLVRAEPWEAKVLQLYEQWRVRHGLCIMGPTGAGKSAAIYVLGAAMGHFETGGVRINKLNPKSLSSTELYGRHDKQTQDWSDGVLTALWRKAMSGRRRDDHSWLLMDGPVDPQWIESLNTVLDDTKTLTLPNNERLAMGERLRLVFEVETLDHASPATVSRVGLVYVGELCLGWRPQLLSWLQRQRREEQDALHNLLLSLCQKALTWMQGQECKCMGMSSSALVVNALRIAEGVLSTRNLLQHQQQAPSPMGLTRMVVFSVAWGMGNPLEPQWRARFDSFLQDCEVIVGGQKGPLPMPPSDAQDSTSQSTVFDYFVDQKSGEWAHWSTLVKRYEPPRPPTPEPAFHKIFVPSADSVRTQYLVDAATRSVPSVPNTQRHALVVGPSGSAKSVTVRDYLAQMSQGNAVVAKGLSLSAATTPATLQTALESFVDKISGTNWGPPPGKRMIIFIDDLSLPQQNEWGDQPTCELIRQVVEDASFYSSAKTESAERYSLVDVQVVAAVQHIKGQTSSGLPRRLRRHFCLIHTPFPSAVSLDYVYGSVLGAHFSVERGFTREVQRAAQQLVPAARRLCEQVRSRMLPVQGKETYVFDMRSMSRLVGGMCRAMPPAVPTVTDLVLLYEHEAHRVYADPMFAEHEQDWVFRRCTAGVEAEFGAEMAHSLQGAQSVWADFVREAEADAGAPEDAGEADSLPPPEHPRVYERAESVGVLTERLQHYLLELNQGHKRRAMELVMFDYAVLHVTRISRVLHCPRGSMLIVGMGGSGRQSLAKLASFVAGHRLVQLPAPGSHYTHALFLDDLREMYKTAALGPAVTFLASDEDLVSDAALECVNVLLTGGEVVGLQQRDEMDLIMEDLRPILEQEVAEGSRVQVLEQMARPEEMHRLYLDRVRNRLHVVLCFSLVGNTLSERTRRFPGLFSGCAINVFRPWPKEALLATAQDLLQQVELLSGAGSKSHVAQHAAALHASVTEVSAQYEGEMERHVYVTSSAFLDFLGCYKQVYNSELAQIQTLRGAVQAGLVTLQHAQEDVLDMKSDLGHKRQQLDAAAQSMDTLMVGIRQQADAAERQTREVAVTRNRLAKTAADIGQERDDAESQLQAAEPALRAAEIALRTIRPEDIATLKKLTNPPILIRRILDGLLILRNFPLETPVHVEHDASGARAIRASWQQGKAMVAEIRFLTALQEFDKDSVNDEHCELLQPYLTMEDFTVERARSACGSLAGLCTWIRSMVHYRSIAKSIAPKRRRLAEAMDQLYKAKRALSKSEKELEENQARLDDMRAQYQRAVDEQAALRDGAEATRRKLLTAESLIGGLNEERERWTLQSQEFHRRSVQLTGDAALLSAFLCYAPPFNHLYRRKILTLVRQDLDKRRLPCTESESFSLTGMLSNEGQRGQWALEGLPGDELSVQNACIVSRVQRVALLVDPQAQGRRWLMQKYARKSLIQPNPAQKDWLRRLEEGCREGRPVLLEDVDDRVDPALDNLLQRRFVRSATADGSVVLLCHLGDREIEVADGFCLYLATKQPNPHFAPSVFTKCCVVDFTVTMGGLADQLLGAVIQHEKASLESDRRTLLEEMQACKAILLQCEEDLLSRLSQQTGRLLDDVCLIEILSATKDKSVEVNEKLTSCRETEGKIADAREEYRPVARRGSVLYFTVAALARIERMYETSLDQFLAHFGAAIDAAPPNPVPAKRVANVVAHETQHIFRAMLRGYYAPDKFLFALLCALSIEREAGDVSAQEADCFLKCGAALDPSQHSPNPGWLSAEAWLNAHAAEACFAAFRRLTFVLGSHEQEWQRWHDHPAPENLPVPVGVDESKLNAFARLTLVRALRPDRTAAAARRWVAQVIGPSVGDLHQTDISQIGGVVNETGPLTPILLLLTHGGDPVAAIEALARRGRTPLSTVSMGDAQEPIAAKHVHAALQEGGWVILQNAHLSLDYCRDLVETLRVYQTPGQGRSRAHDTCRIWLTAEPERRFPLALLQQCVKVAVEPPAGVRAGLASSYQMITQDQLDSINHGEWRVLLYTLCFLHSALCERRKFGSLGFSVPYEFSHHDLVASQTFLYNYLYTDIKVGVSWKTVQYMICDVQYGGRVTDRYDMRILAAYGDRWLRDELFERAPEFTFYHGYKAPDLCSVQEYQSYIAGLPAEDRPELFGMHSSAGLELNKCESQRLLDYALKIQPRHAAAPTAGETRQDVILRFARNVAQRFDSTFQQDVQQYLRRAQKMRSHGHLSTPIELFAHQELNHLLGVITMVQSGCEDLHRVADGVIAATAALRAAGDAVYDGRVPSAWEQAGLPVSSARLGAWVDHLARRVENMTLWMTRGPPRCFWLPGFCSPQGFLTALRQEATRARQPAWTLETVFVRSEVSRWINPDSIHQDLAIEQGAYISGLTLTGASWDRQGQHLAEPSTRSLLSPLPITLLRCQPAAPSDGRHYQCPVYRHPSRTMRHFIFCLNLRCGDTPAETWVLRGAAALCSVHD